MVTKEEVCRRDAEVWRLMEEDQLRSTTIAERLGISMATVSRAWRREWRRRQIADLDDEVELEFDEDDF